MHRRLFLQTGFGAAAAAAAQGVVAWDPSLPFLNVTRPLVVQPIFQYVLPKPREQASYKSWGGVQTEEAVRQEAARIEQELAKLAGPTLRFLPVTPVTTPDQAARVHQGNHDAILLYACTGGGQLLQSCVSPRGNTLIFVRHRSGPVYYWYEALSTRYLTGDLVHVDDVTVDDYAELRTRLRGLNGALNLRGTRIVALGGSAGKYAPDAPEVARKKFGMEIIETGYEDLERRIKSARADSARTAEAEACTRRYLDLPATTLRTQRPFVVNAFLLYRIFKDILAEHQASAFTIRNCMNTVMPMSETTACLSLSLMCDEGLIAFCESDFVIIPPGILMRHVSGLPVFMHNSTFPHQRMVTCAHCTGPRRMNGIDYSPTLITTHYESEYGAAPKVDLPIGQGVSFISPEFTTGRWVGIRGIVRDNPNYEICRSQQDVEIQGDWEALKHEVRDSHWVMAYGAHTNPLAYAARKLGVRWTAI